MDRIGHKLSTEPMQTNPFWPTLHVSARRLADGASAMVADFKVEVIARLSGNECMRVSAEGCARPAFAWFDTRTLIGVVVRSRLRSVCCPPASCEDDARYTIPERM
jgi:hypothetical protein